jgi:hypothetical protein
MLTNFLDKSKPINFIVLLIFFISSLFFNVFFDGFSSDKLLKGVLLIFLFLSIFFIYNFIISKNKLTLDNSYAFYLFTLLSTSILPELLTYNTLILGIVYLLFTRKLYSLRSPKNILEKLFDCSFWLGTLFILEPYTLLFFILIYAACYLHNKITIHTLTAPILGFIIPLILYFTYFFWFDKPEEFTSLFDFKINFDLNFYAETKYFWWIISLFFLTVFAIFLKSIKVLSVKNTFRKSWILLILNFAVLIVFQLFLPQKRLAELVFILFPVSVILANGIEMIQKKLIKNIILFLFLIGSIIMHYFL